MNDGYDMNEREDVPFPAHGPVNVPDAYEMAGAAAAAAGFPFPAAPVLPVQQTAFLGQPSGAQMRLPQRGVNAAPPINQIVTPEQVIGLLSRLNPDKVRLAGSIFGRGASAEGALLGALCRVDPPILTALLSLAGDVVTAIKPSEEHESSDLLVRLELLGTVLTVMSRPQQHAQALQAIGLLLG